MEQEQLCKTCRFWDGRFSGICRKYPPKVIIVDVERKDTKVYHQKQTLWPDTDEDDWCGEWEAKTPAPEVIPGNV